MPVWSAQFEKLRAPLPDLLSLSGSEARTILALRQAIVCQKLMRDPRSDLEDKLGNGLAVNRFLVMLETVGHAWPDNFHLGRTCCPKTTADEITLLQMIRNCAAGDRPAFDRLLCDMIGEDFRDRIFTDIRNFVTALDQPAPG